MNYIIEFTPHIENNINYNYLSDIEYKIKNKISLTNEELNNFLNTIIYLTRYKIDPNLNNYDYKCDLAQSILYYYLKKLDCNIHPLSTQNSITSNITGHSFITLELLVNNKLTHYLLDPTYIQFFKHDKCTKNNYYIHPSYKDYILLTPDPGYFIQDNMKEQAKFLLNHGYIELTEPTAQMYGDSFYNTKTGPNTNNLKYQSIPGFIYLNSFTKNSTTLSKTEEELINQELYIPSFQNQEKKSR